MAFKVQDDNILFLIILSIFYCHGIKLVIELDGGIHDLEDVKIR